MKINQRSRLQIVRMLSLKANLPQKGARAAMEGLVELVLAGARTEGSFPLPGLGWLEVYRRRERAAWNPRTGEKFTVPAKPSVRFRLSPKAAAFVLEPLIAAEKAAQEKAAAEKAAKPAAKPAAKARKAAAPAARRAKKK